MAEELDALLARVSDESLRADLRREVNRLRGRRSFGLVFERHLPERVRLYSHPVRRGCTVAPRADNADTTWTVERVAEGKATVRHADGTQSVEDVGDLVVVAEFGDAIYPGLKHLEPRIDRGGDKPAHVVINGENHHALEALRFSHAGKIDCIYIDPPYNTGARDWKYDNDYVDGDDAYRHSKWLAFMERRLRLAKELLRPDDAVLIVTIDEREYLRLGLLLEQTFPGSRIRMISTVINPKGVGVTEGFKRVDEYLFIVRLGAQDVVASADTPLGSAPLDKKPNDDSDEAEQKPVGLDWQTARRRDLASVRPTRPAQFYPVYVNTATGHIEAIGEAIPHAMDRRDAPDREGCIAVFPVRDDGTEMNWAVTAPTFRDRWQKGYCRAGKAQAGKPQPYIIQYLKSGPIADIEEGRAVVEGRNADGSVIAFYSEVAAKTPPTQWNMRSHNAEHYGTKVVKTLLPGRVFPFPKSLYAVEDVIRLFVANKPDAIVLDFFAGSGTTTHAIARLNKQDAGRRQSISITNNEVSSTEAKALTEAGHRAGDAEWEAQGIFEHITRPRITAAITGRTPDGDPIKGDYKFTDEFPMAEGFEESVQFFELTYQDPQRVDLGAAFEAIAPLLWLRAGGTGGIITTRTDADGGLLTHAWTDLYGVLFDPDRWSRFADEVPPMATTAFVVTDSDSVFEAVARELPSSVDTVRLYENYLSTFEIGRA